MFTVAREPLTSILESGLARLLRAHWLEVAHDQDEIDLDPDWEAYLADERAGRFVAWSARTEEKLVGYNAFFVVPHRHYRKAIFALNDVIYLKPEQRGSHGLVLIAEAERGLKELGVRKAFYHVKEDSRLGSPAGDSLEAVEDLIELEDATGFKLENAPSNYGLGTVLSALGYIHTENQFGKLLGEG